MAITFVNKGTWAAGTTSISPGIPASMQAGDFMILQVHTCNQAVTTPSGWTAATTSPVSTGTANTAGGTRISVYYRWWQSGNAAPTVAVTGGTVTNGIIVGYRGVDPTTPFDGVTPVATTLAAASTTLTMTGLTTQTASALIHWAVARDQDLGSTTAVTAFTNANLTGITEVHDQVVNTGVGGGIWTGYGFKATAGATGNLTITQTSSIAVGITFALRAKPNNYPLTAQGGSYSLTGASATLSRNKNLIASGGSYALTGGDAVLTWAATPSGYTLTAQGGTYTLSGSSGILLRSKQLTGSGGSYIITGQQATLKRSKLVTANGGSYSLSGSASTLLKSKRIAASGGSYTVTGSNATLLRSKLLIAQGGTYTYTGQQVTITYGASASAYVLTAQGGSYQLTGSSASLLRSKSLIASGGTYSYTGANAILLRNRQLTAQAGSYLYSGSNAYITYTPSGGYPSPNQVLLGVVYGPAGEYTGTLDLGKKFRIDIATGNIVMVLDGKKVMSL